MSDHLTGRFHVRVVRPAFSDASKVLPRTRDQIELRRHVLKLRYWPEASDEERSGQLIDLDWSWVRSCPNLKIGELRIHDVIGGNDNLRVMFFVGPPCDRLRLQCIWILAVFQKKRDDFTVNQVAIFKGRRQIVLERFYKD